MFINLKKLLRHVDEKRRIYNKKKENIIQYKQNGNDINVKLCLTNEEKKRIDNFYLEHYGQKIPYFFHEVYKSFSGKFDVRYFPESIYEAELQRYCNPMGFVDVFEDKNMIPMLADSAHIKIPQTIIYKIKDFYFDNQHNIINENQAIELLSKEERIILKPSVDTHGGEGIEVFDIKKLSFNGISKVIKKYKTNFIIQKCIQNEESLRKIHPESLNTIRIVTYIIGGKIKNILPVLRMGVGNSHLDNASAGGIITGINLDGKLTKYAIKQYCKGPKITEHPDSKIKFEGYFIPKFKDVVIAAKKMHSLIPQVGFVDWDFVIDEEGVPVLIEANLISGGGMRMSQWVHGKAAFGEDTEKILEWLSVVRKMHQDDRKKENVYL